LKEKLNKQSKNRYSYS